MNNDFKIAGYIAGDENIIYQAIVALTSLKKYNKEIDTYLFIDKKRLTKEQIILLKKNRIYLPDFFINYKFTSSLRWPPEVFWNYYCPEYLFDLGYEYSIKIDADTLCIKKIDWKCVLPTKEAFSAVDACNCVDYYLVEERKFLLDEFNFNKISLKSTYPNVGVLIVNNKLYKNNNIWQKIIDYHNRIVRKSKSKSIDIIFADQALFAIILSTNRDIIWKNISKKYNYTIHDITGFNKDDIDSNLYIIHFTGKKPWEKTTIFDILYNPYTVLYRKIYFKYLIDESMSYILHNIRKNNLGRNIFMQNILFDRKLYIYLIKGIELIKRIKNNG